MSFEEMVGPAYAGMIPPARSMYTLSWGRPRVCGDDPRNKIPDKLEKE